MLNRPPLAPVICACSAAALAALACGAEDNSESANAAVPSSSANGSSGDSANGMGAGVAVNTGADVTSGTQVTAGMNPNPSTGTNTGMGTNTGTDTPSTGMDTNTGMGTNTGADTPSTGMDTSTGMNTGASMDPDPVMTPDTDDTGMAVDAEPTALDGRAVDCTFDQTSSSSQQIGTVGVVEWSTTLPSVDAAEIEFGLTEEYGLTAPVDLGEAGYRTLLLGMKPGRTYNYRIVAHAGGDACASQNFTIETGARPTDLPNVTIQTPNPDALDGGFLVTGTYQTGPAYIMDGDGEFVWWYNMGEVTRARMSYDGKFMWMVKGNVPQGQAKVVRVAMDGTGEEDLSGQFADLNHDLALTSDGRVVFFAYSSSGCDDIKVWSEQGGAQTIVNAADAHGAGSPCHLNALHYSPEDDTIVFSDLDHNNITKVNMDGSTVWVLGGTTSDFSGDGSQWNRQHGFHLLGTDRILIFNNSGLGASDGGGFGNGSSLGLEIALDLASNTATLEWQYDGGGIANQIMGDIQRLDNGNTLVNYSTQGIVHEVDPSGTLVQSLTWGLGGAIGYSMKRHTLYGPPPKL